MKSDKRISSRDYVLLSAYVDGEIDAGTRVDLVERLESDESLRAELQSLRHTVDLVRALPEVAAPRDFTVSESMLAKPERRASLKSLAFVPRQISLVASIILTFIGIYTMSLDFFPTVPENMQFFAMIDANVNSDDSAPEAAAGMTAKQSQIDASGIVESSAAEHASGESESEAAMAGRSGAMQSERTSRQGAFPKLPTGPAILILGLLLFAATMASLRSNRG